jgi:hypothetical protein
LTGNDLACLGVIPYEGPGLGPGKEAMTIILAVLSFGMALSAEPLARHFGRATVTTHPED